MKTILMIISLSILLISTFARNGENEIQIKQAFTDTLCTPDPSPEAIALYRYLLDMNGLLTLSGNQWVQWGIHELEYVENLTGKLPAIAGFDYINSSENAVENQRAIEFWRSGGIPTIMWHWGAPSKGEGYYASQATIGIDSCFIEGTEHYEEFWYELDRKADLLEVLRDSNIPVLWRPLHELNGGWFWWSKEGAEKFKQIWITMYNYFVYDRGLNNLIWVLCYTDKPDLDWYPGDEYVDAVGGDTYDGADHPHYTMYTKSKEVAGDNNYPICFHECGLPPNMDECLERNIIWSWWMIWHTGILQSIDTDYLTWLYNHELIITKDELPDIMSVYNWDDSCSPTEVTASMQVNENEWADTNTVYVGPGAQVVLAAEATGDGVWNWNGCGLSGTDNEQTLIAEESCTIIASYLNECGATTSQTFNLVVDPKYSFINISQSDGYSFVKLYPLPAEDILYVELSGTEEDIINTVLIYSVDGSLIIEKTEVANKFSLNISDLVKGFYFIKIRNVKFHVTRKFLKNY